jgi:hypothetical protein
MNRFFTLLQLANAHRPLIRLALLAGGLLALAAGVGAPECPGDGGC